MSTTLAKDDYHLNDTQKQIRLASIACVCVSAVFVALRCFVRAHLQSQFSVDDWLLLLGLTGYAVMTVFLVLSINDGGFGRKTGELPVSVLHTGLKYVVLSETSYSLALLITKLSIALLQLRIIGQASRITRRINFASIGANVIISIYALFTLLFQCTPPEKFWTPTIAKGHCADRTGVTIGVYVSSAVQLALDWYYALALVPLVWRLQMRTVVKISTMFVLGVGVFASIANIIRFKYLVGYSKSADQLYVFIPVVLWTWIEMCLGICAAAVATFRPLIRLLSCASSRNGSRKYTDDRTLFVSWITRKAPNKRLQDHMELSNIDFANMAMTARGGTIINEATRENEPESVGDGESQRHILEEQLAEAKSP